MTRVVSNLALLLILAATASFAEPPKSKPSAAAIKRRLHGTWAGGLCVGELTIRADGSYERRHFSPGDNHHAGTWEVRWDALPPILVLNCETSDRQEPVEKTTEVELVQLDDEALVTQSPDQQFITHYERKGPATLERKLRGQWQGPACVGELTLREDGTFLRTGYTPGNNKLTGTWELGWDALPPTLRLNCKTSDAPDRLPVGEITEYRIIKLNDQNLICKHSEDAENRTHFERIHAPK